MGLFGDSLVFVFQVVGAKAVGQQFPQCHGGLPASVGWARMMGVLSLANSRIFWRQPPQV